MTKTLSNAATGRLGPRPGNDTTKALPGESYLLDIPKGVEDSIERLMRAAALRIYKPEFFDGDYNQAYKTYLQLPNGLPKIRYEAEAWRACQGYINKLRNKGFKEINDILPFSKFGLFLKGVETPPDLISKCSEIVRELIAMDNAIKGTGHKHSMDQTGLVTGGVGTVRQVLDAKFIIKAKRAENERYGIDDDNEYDDVLAEESLFEEEMKLIKPADGPDITLPNRFLDTMVEQGEWSNLNALAEELLLHAAFMIVPYTSRDKVTGAETVMPMGQYSFKEFTAAMQVMESAKERREATRSRFRAALLMSTPYSLSLKADGVHTVQDLVKINLPDLNMPEVYMEQVESFLNVAVSLAVESKIAPTLRDFTKPNKVGEFSVPALFDPRFQLSPYDPYGRPPRLGPIKNNIKKKTKAEREEEKRQKIAAAEIPKGLWDPNYKAPDSASQKVPALFAFNATKHGAEAKKIAEDSKAADTFTQSDENLTLGQRMLKESGLLPEEAPSTRNGLPLSPIAKRNMGFARKKFDRKAFEATKQANPRKHDFEAHVRRGFQRPHKCIFPGCGQAFSRLYTLKVHERSHELYSRYHEYKRQPQMYYDPGLVGMAEDTKEFEERKHQLPPLAKTQVDTLRFTASKSRGGPRVSTTGDIGYGGDNPGYEPSFDMSYAYAPGSAPMNDMMKKNGNETFDSYSSAPSQSHSQPTLGLESSNYESFPQEMPSADVPLDFQDLNESGIANPFDQPLEELADFGGDEEWTINTSDWA